MCAFTRFRVFTHWEILVSRVSFYRSRHDLIKNSNTYAGSGGRRGWDCGFSALHRHHSGTGRKDTRNVNVVGTKTGLSSFVY